MESHHLGRDRDRDNTPNYPDYTSGANSVSGATTRALALFFGRDSVTFSIESRHPLAVQKTRTYQRFSVAAADVVDARIYWVSISVSRTPRRVARAGAPDWAFKHFHLALDDDDDDNDDDDDDDDDGDHHH